MPSFSQTEKTIINTLKNNSSFTYNNQKYKLLEFDKPTTSLGEPKTDIYILAQDSNKNHFEFKISVKQSNADFLENKMKAERAKEIFGLDWKNIITLLTDSVRNDFINQPLIFKVKQGKTEEGVFTLGWKFEILNKSASNRSAELPNELLREVLTGENLNKDKRDAFINGEIIQNSGVSNFILNNAENIDLTNLDLIMSKLLTIDEYINNPMNKVYFACKALNYRTKYIKKDTSDFSHKWDGDRPLCVYINWFENNGKLDYEFCFNNPLTMKGNAVASNLKNALDILNISNTDDINETNLNNFSLVYK